MTRVLAVMASFASKNNEKICGTIRCFRAVKTGRKVMGTACQGKKLVSSAAGRSF